MKYLTEEQSAKNVRDFRPIPFLIEAEVLTQKPQEGHINIMNGVIKSKKPKYNVPLSINIMGENLQHANLVKGDLKKNRRIRTAYLTQYDKIYDDRLGKKQREKENKQLQRQEEPKVQVEVQVDNVEQVSKRKEGQIRRRGRERNEKKERKDMGEEDEDAGYDEL